MEHIWALPPLEALQAVLAAARLGSFSAAAGALDITHGAVSRRIAAVEAWAGIRLFSRHGRGVRLTLEGERLASRIELAVAMLEDSRTSGGAEPELDTIRVGVVQSFARLWLIPRLPDLEGRPPDLRIEADIDHRHMAVSDARIAIRLGQGNWAGVVAEPLFDETLQPVATPDIANALGKTPRLGDLLALPLLHDATEDGWRFWLSGQGIAYQRRAKDRTFEGHDLALQAAAAGLGVALARDPYGRAFRQRLGLVAVHPRGILSPQKFHIVTRPGPRHPAVDRLVERLRKMARAA
ncbi:LysR substrate-binding domain-containing protein [Reyranella sp. CPCC 100927]|uniref:LysR substrate-binding domain-containing protein n=1 Tax=Reyranella sp. CPCC 100927 TaxID=2599616 RepID=UPI0011B62C13|nr:LysR substrate-binding domain-containing protein [Reyranella sp. CPCC 100927]TWT15350.1 LysR family transcriptional regulator [Reyranella sp. CPCC 100927]